jgi:benzoate/toluate 1,2-dioxygenase subunit beta
VSTAVDHRAVEQFVFREARLADEHAYDEWESLWTDDAQYWVPAADDSDAERVMSVINDNRTRIRTRIKQLDTGRRYSQAPPSRLSRTISNIEIGGPVGGDGPDAADVVVHATFVLLEAKEHTNRTWGGRLTYQLRASDGTFGLVRKKIDLVDRPWVLPTMSFLI